MDFKQLKAFLTITETGNVTRAAELLNIVQPAVSRQLRLLEEDIGQSLFERERHGMVLTPAGQSLVTYARRAMLELDRARAEISGADRGVGGLVTLGLLPSSIDPLASPFVREISASFPGIQVRISMGYAGTLLKWLELGEVDAALLYGAERSSEIETTPLIEEPLWVIGLPKEKLRPSRPVALEALQGRPLILPSAHQGIRTLVDHACARAGVSLSIAVETNALSVQRNLVLGGHGLTILPPMAVSEDLRSKRLCGAPLSNPPISRTIVLALPLNRPTGQHVRTAVDVLSSCAKDAVEAGSWTEGRWLGGSQKLK